MKASNPLICLVAMLGSLSIAGCFTARKEVAPATPPAPSANDEHERGVTALREIQDALAHDTIDTTNLRSWTEDAHVDWNNLKALCSRDEGDYEQIRRNMILPWEESWIRKDSSVLLSFLTPGASVPSLRFDTAKSTRNLGGIEVRDRKIGWVSEPTDPKASFDGFLNMFSRVEDAEIVGTEILSPNALRDQNLRMREAAILVHFDVRGFLPNEARHEERGKLRLHLIREKTGDEWKISRMEVVEQEALTSSRAPTFADATDASGINAAIQPHLRREAIRRGGYALAVSDFDGDGKQDILVGTAGAPALLRGDGHGHFIPVSVPGLSDETFVKSAAFADFGNTGHEDLLLVRFVPSDPASPRDVVMYRNDGKGGYLSPVVIPEVRQHVYAMPMTIADFNNDGLLDFYVGFPGAKDFTFYQDSFRAPDLKVQGLYLNQGNGSFQSQSIVGFDDKALLTDRQQLYPHSALAVDYDRDGRMDIVVMDDRGNLSPMYHNLDGKHFEQVADAIGVVNFSLGMSADAGDLFGDGQIAMVMSNANFHALNRFSDSCRKNWGVHEINDPPGLKVFRRLSNGNYADWTHGSGLEWAGEGLAGVEIVDYNLDGHPDIFVSNGLWTGTDRKQDLSSLFVRSFALHGQFGADRSLADTQFAPHSMFMDILSGYRGDLADMSAPGTARPGMAGRQHKRLFRNEGNGHFTEVGFFEGVDSVADGYVVARADLFGTGRPDLILRSGDPGFRTDQFPTIQVFRNNGVEHLHPLKITLRGTRSNHDAIGAEVTVKTKAGAQVQQLMGNNGASQSEKALFFGLGQSTVADLVQVRWPSGTYQTLKNVRSGSIVITEPTNRSIAGAPATAASR